ncbi:hypothetical protein ACFO5K_18600 [Nocardia halotolerans]|uniref:Uncharacterized protein n=1 Tax=Nocardia halotolerans TaxID=1755878 RepID=A0ABV8VJ69_9NOCA
MHTELRTRPETGTADLPSPAETTVRWPDPSPLQDWWTEVMDGVPQYPVRS